MEVRALHGKRRMLVRDSCIPGALHLSHGDESGVCETGEVPLPASPWYRVVAIDRRLHLDTDMRREPIAASMRWALLAFVYACALTLGSPLAQASDGHWVVGTWRGTLETAYPGSEGPGRTMRIHRVAPDGTEGAEHVVHPGPARVC